MEKVNSPSNIRGEQGTTQKNDNDVRAHQSGARGRGNGHNRASWRNSGRRGGRNFPGNGPNIQGATTTRDFRAENAAPNPPPPPRPRPTHFLALPLHNHPALRNAVASFQAALFEDPHNMSGIKHDSEDQRHPMHDPPAGSSDPHPKKQTWMSKRAKQQAKTKVSPIVQGLDSSILIDPRRLHLTLGVMTLEAEPRHLGQEGKQANDLGERPKGIKSDFGLVARNTSQIPKLVSPPATLKTISSALTLLNSLKPRIEAILDGSKGIQVPLEVMDVLKTERMRTNKGQKYTANTPQDSKFDYSDIAGRIENVVKVRGDVKVEQTIGARAEKKEAEKSHANSATDVIASTGDEMIDSPKVGAGVLFLGPSHINETDIEKKKLMQVCDLVHMTFKEAGYITDTRPLKLHCTIINASHRKPPRRLPFSYSDILQQVHAMELISPNFSLLTSSTSASTSQNVSAANYASSMTQRPRLVIPLPVPTKFGSSSHLVETIELWEMGSHGPNNEYISHGGIRLGPSQ